MLPHPICDDLRYRGRSKTSSRCLLVDSYTFTLPGRVLMGYTTVVPPPAVLSRLAGARVTKAGSGTTTPLPRRTTGAVHLAGQKSPVGLWDVSESIQGASLRCGRSIQLPCRFCRLNSEEATQSPTPGRNYILNILKCFYWILERFSLF